MQIPTYMNLKRLNHLLIRLGHFPSYNSSTSESHPPISGLYIKSLLDAVIHVQTLCVWREKKTGGRHLIDIQ